MYNGGVDLAQVADDLYGLDPADFTAARDERARQARAEGEKDLVDAIKKLRRPTVSASLVNRLVREAADQVDGLLDLGQSLREAQQSLAGDQLRSLSAQRRPVIHALAQEAKRLAAQSGRAVSDQVEREVEATLEAALADPAAAGAVRSGRLTTALGYAGFGGVDVADAVAIPDTAAVAAPPERARLPGADVSRHHAAPTGEQQVPAARGVRESGAGAGERRKDGAGAGEREAEAKARERQEAETRARDMREAQAVARDAADGLDDAARRVTEVRHVREAAKRRIEELEQQLENAQAQEAEAARVLRDAERSRDAAARLAAEAQRRLARARAKVEESRKAYGQRPPPRG